MLKVLNTAIATAVSLTETALKHTTTSANQKDLAALLKRLKGCQDFFDFAFGKDVN